MKQVEPDFQGKTPIPLSVIQAAQSQDRVNGLTHNFYRYPARFSPTFVGSVIDHFSEPGDLILDPFMGGGTTLVEAIARGRCAIGCDISSLATFVSQAKTTTLSECEISGLEVWFHNAINDLNLNNKVEFESDWVEAGYLRNLDGAKTWRHKKLIQLMLDHIGSLPSGPTSEFARCVLLRTAQSKIDTRKDFGSVERFRAALKTNFSEMVERLRELRDLLDTHESRPTAIAINQDASTLETKAFPDRRRPKLILTSPPYPGVHVLYHRWQVNGGRETPAPYWIANRLDGKGISYYTLGDRKEKELRTYFKSIEKIFSAARSLADPQAIFVQMVAFSQPDWQLPRYLQAMESAGLEELSNDRQGDAVADRIWRQVPNRKWYAHRQPNQSSSQEVVLFHKLA